MAEAFAAIRTGALWGAVTLLGGMTLLLLWAGVRAFLVERRIPESTAHAETGRSLTRRFGAVMLLLAAGLALLSASLAYRLVEDVLAPTLFAWEIAGLLIAAVGVWQFRETRRRLNNSLRELKEDK